MDCPTSAKVGHFGQTCNPKLASRIVKPSLGIGGATNPATGSLADNPLIFEASDIFPGVA